MLRWSWVVRGPPAAWDKPPAYKGRQPPYAAHTAASPAAFRRGKDGVAVTKTVTLAYTHAGIT